MNWVAKGMRRGAVGLSPRRRMCDVAARGVAIVVAVRHPCLSLAQHPIGYADLLVAVTQAGL